MGNSIDNLKEAFTGESQASRRYLYFAEMADKEGNRQIARLFRAASDAETVHARNHLNVLGVGTTAANLQEAINGEHYEFTQMYPGFIDIANSEKNSAAETSFIYANKVEKIHHNLYSKALLDLKGKQVLREEPYFVCQICGNTIAGAAPAKCPICGSPRELFKKTE